jgi:Cu/Ag efflux protein CusF
MKMPALLLVIALGTACTQPDKGPASEAASPPQAGSPSPAPAPPPAAVSTASATGIVEDVDPAARTITIAHGPVESLKWPAMTMTFKAPNTDLSTIQKGDRVTFEFSSTGMDGTIVAIRHQ